MTIDYGLGAILALLIMAYLLFALVRPDDF